MINSPYQQNTLELKDQTHTENQKQKCNLQEFGLKKAHYLKAYDVNGLFQA